jgi:hypothetical protein
LVLLIFNIILFVIISHIRKLKWLVTLRDFSLYQHFRFRANTLYKCITKIAVLDDTVLWYLWFVVRISSVFLLPIQDVSGSNISFQIDYPYSDYFLCGIPVVHCSLFPVKRKIYVQKEWRKTQWRNMLQKGEYSNIIYI